MNISRISAMAPVQTYFEGNKNKKHIQNQPNPTSAGIAVPLATLIAMTPMISTEANAVSSKTIEYSYATNPIDFIKKDKAASLIKTEKYTGNDGIERKVYYVGDKLNSKNVKDIYINDGDLDGKRITEYKNITLKLIGDDGIAGKEFTFPQLTVQSTDEDTGKFGYTERAISDNLAKFLLSKENKTGIITKNITRRLNACQYGLKNAEIQNHSVWNGKDAKINGEKIASTKRKIGGNIYTITAYNTNQNESNYEILTIKRNDGAELRLAGLKNVDVNLIDAGEPIGTFKYKQISLMNSKNLEVSRVFNDELFDELAKLTKDYRNKAFKMENVEETQIVDHKGNIYDVE